VWFEGTTAVELEVEALIVPNTFAEEYIATRFKDILDEKLRSLLSPTAEIRPVIGKSAPHDRGGAALGDCAAPINDGGSLERCRAPGEALSVPFPLATRLRWISRAIYVEFARLSDPSKRASHAERTRPCINEHDVLCN